MARSDTPEHGQNARVVRDLLTPELRQNFKYIYGRLVAWGRGQGLTLLEAEDLAQDALVRALQRRDRFSPRPGVPLVAWLLRLAQNLFFDRMRAEQSRRRAIEKVKRDQTADHAAASQHSSLTDAESSRRREQLLLELPEELRPTFWAWVEQRDRGTSGDKAAEKLGMTVDELEATKKRVRRAIERSMRALGYNAEDLLSTAVQYARIKRKAGGDDEE